MHIPDGFLDLKTAGLAAGLAAGGLGLALRVAQRQIPRRRVPLMGLSAAVIFAAQMINFPVAGGTSGHLMGAVLAVVLVGLAPAIVIMSAVMIVQCFMFSDGGVTALGANVLNMAVLGSLMGWVVYGGLRRLFGGRRGLLLGAAFAGWCSVVVSALACGAELACSGWVSARVVLPAMGGVHMLIGLGEAAITALVLAAVMRTRPELLEGEDLAETGGRGNGAWVGAGLLLAVGLAVGVAPFASALPDGLEAVVEALGFAEQAKPSPLPAPLPEYRMPWISSAGLATALAGAVGTLIAFALAMLLARLLAPKRTSAQPGPVGTR